MESEPRNMYERPLLPMLLASRFNFEMEPFNIVTNLFVLYLLYVWWLAIHGLSTRHANIRTYIDTAFVVLTSYASLHVNWDYIWLAIFPFITLAFIIALCIEELCGESRSLQHSSGAGEAHLSSTGTSASKDEEKKTKSRFVKGKKRKSRFDKKKKKTKSRFDKEKKTKSRLKLVAILEVSYWVLCLCAMEEFHHVADKYAISQFLLFLSSTLVALTLMMARLVPTGVTPGLAAASELLHKASLVALLVTVHTVAAELLGEDVVMFCLPEFVPVLLWFSVHLDRGSSIITVDKIKRHKSGLVALSTVVAAALAYLAASMDESGLSRCTKTLVSCGVSGLLIYYVVFMLCQWPGQASTATTTSLKEAVELLQFWANVLLIAAAALLVLASLAAVRLGLHEPMVATLAKFFYDYAGTFLLLTIYG